MTPIEYYKAAEKHLSYCINWRDKMGTGEPEEGELLEIYYLLGYVVECFTIFTIYRIGHWNPTGRIEGSNSSITRDALKKDIEEYFDPVFTYYTKYDFFDRSGGKNARTVHRLIKEEKGDKNNLGKNEYAEVIDGNRYIIWEREERGIKLQLKQSTELAKTKAACSTIISGEVTAKCCVQGHRFQNAIESVILKELYKDGLSEIDFFATYKTNKKKNSLFKLVAEWEPVLRYCSKISQWEKLGKKHTESIITKENIYSLVDVLRELEQKLQQLKK